ncbi:hypothetical protein IB277_07300 [Ensifer sp. ENS07]|uniref:hypothetical protein n=1 Tax=Ensifer sp. ENS07 TaxID=2769274 RepID=UPI0019CBAAC7|nr:hypothetical protein [Ensifer sp. ENS07]MBD9636099.1 hypothetical protein [Ensifer sp. ENS07]
MNIEDDGDIPTRISRYTFKDRDRVRREISDLMGWLEKSRRKDRFDVVRLSIEELFLGLESRVLDHFRDYVGGPDFIHKDEAWLAACRQREFVKEVCARMVEGPDEEPTPESEAIREMDVGPSIKVIPDYSKRRIQL